MRAKELAAGVRGLQSVRVSSRGRGETGVVVKKATTNPIANGGQADIYLGLLYSGTKVPTLAVVMKRLRVHRGADMKTCQRGKSLVSQRVDLQDDTMISIEGRPRGIALERLET